ncbi:unnamed protein product [Adineta ricciae]|uniref:Uncharacterized protein n=1 Tax=Adineta ricciae TaxID=249248 RepID=A0A814ASP0_ADIRI|nr:unnamed protein product [Adineta ricciae]
MNSYVVTVISAFSGKQFVKKKTGTNRLPGLYHPTLLRSEVEYKREISRKHAQIDKDNTDTIRRRNAHNHVFVYSLLSKRHQWYDADKSFRDTCRISWTHKPDKQSVRKSRAFLPDIYPPKSTSPTIVSPLHRFDGIEDTVPAVANERIKQNFFLYQPVLLEIALAPHSSRVMGLKNYAIARKQSAYRRQTHLQETATEDDRFTQLLAILEDN